MCVAGHTRGTAVPWRVIQQGHGRPVAHRHPCRPRRVGASPARVGARRVGIPTPEPAPPSSPPAKGPRGIGTHRGAWAGVLAEPPAAGRRFYGFFPAWGFVRCQRGRAAGSPRATAVPLGRTAPRGPWACSEGTRGRPACVGAGTCGVQVAAGSGGERGSCFPSQGPPANPGVRGGSGATCARACAHAGHLLKHGEIFFFSRNPGRCRGRVCTGACTLGAGGSRQRSV